MGACPTLPTQLHTNIYKEDNTMSKNTKKIAKQMANEVLETVLKEMECKHQSMLSAGAQEQLESDQFRKEAYAKLEDWVTGKLTKELDFLNQRMDSFIEKVQEKLKKDEKRLDKMEYAIKEIKKEGKRAEKKVTDLKKSDKHEKQILTQIAVSVGAATDGSSFKEVRKGYKNFANKSYYSRIPDESYYNYVLGKRRCLDQKNILDVQQ